RRAWRGDVEVPLTAREMALLEFLLRHRGDVVSKTDILDHVWDGSFDGDLNIVEVYVGHLRAKLDRPFDRDAIQTVRGSGYRLAAAGGAALREPSRMDGRAATRGHPRARHGHRGRDRGDRIRPCRVR